MAQALNQFLQLKGDHRFVFDDQDIRRERGDEFLLGAGQGCVQFVRLNAQNAQDGIRFEQFHCRQEQGAARQRRHVSEDGQLLSCLRQVFRVSDDRIQKPEQLDPVLGQRCFCRSGGQDVLLKHGFDIQIARHLVACHRARIAAQIGQFLREQLVKQILDP